MLQLKCRTEFSFRECFGPISKVLAATQGPVGICDRNGTWGHIAFFNECKKVGRKPLLGVELAVVEDASVKEKQGINWMSFIARNAKGLKQLYELVSLSTSDKHFYYQPRIDYPALFDLTDDVIIFSGSHPAWGSLPRFENVFVELSPVSSMQSARFAAEKKFKTVAVSDNFFPTIDDKKVYEIFAGDKRQMRTRPMHQIGRAHV